jgi:very-short-patch-repair endonuclease
MIEYIVFFGLLAAGLLAFMFHRKPEPVVNMAAAERYKCESPIERRLYDALVFRGYAVSTQVKCGKYRIDLALVGPQIAIECDGKAYHSSTDQKAHDRRKDAYLKEHGWQVMRFSGRQITSRLPDVLKRIDAKIKTP